jgi:cell fate (sporulation/competence/biofilm development) regulator YlbF (YheA/YmcA/DUF963 family)
MQVYLIDRADVNHEVEKTMKDILKKADELGHLIKRTEVFRDFEEAENNVNNDSIASLLLKKYNELAETIQLRQKAGDKIENFETERFAEITEEVGKNSLLMDYLAKRESYIALLMKIHTAISG